LSQLFRMNKPSFLEAWLILFAPARISKRSAGGVSLATNH